MNLTWKRNRHILNRKDYALGVSVLYDYILIKCKPKVGIHSWSLISKNNTSILDQIWMSLDSIQ